MSNTDFLGRAINTVKLAIEQDTAGEYKKAYELYFQSCTLHSEALPKSAIMLTWPSGIVYACDQM